MHPTSAAPSESNENSVPSKSPSSSTSTPPSIRQPSSSPTSSAHPSAIEPPGQSFSIYPSLKPSESLSATPTNELSHEPSASSTGHSSKPSKRQDVTYKPTTMIQSLSPSMLKEGSIWPSTTPSIAAHVPSAMPSFQSNEIPPMTNILPPSQSPSISTRPSELADASLPPSAESSLSRPTPLPSDASSSKSTSPSSEQGMDSVPSLEPSSSPPINSKPHPMTSGKPSVISQPSSLPPTSQYAPSNIPSHAPSVVSTNPTSLHSDNPSSPAPSSSQSFTAKPTLYDSVAPSVLNSSSTRPSVKAISTSTPTHCDVLRDRLFDPCTEANEVGWAGIRVTITLGDGVAYSQTYTDPNGY
ncbi:hypothetical protein THAOC_25300 [Thalassiosira oceanica]|uniref:Uncharacterized protein n=1 Tax=Thalassiosira oceanica TaxID=159749 RepID=K0S1T6_THAOC|nr:hypothetical protein THAOC_25300 [Thalassiosira oceanica]|eukprot:EJK55016.1 hypothetical protein THAOC_25300 [Thalassiosira oceanica]